MTSVYKKPSHNLLTKTWDEKNLFKRPTKLQSNDSCNKVKAKVHQDSGKLGVEFTIDKTLPNFNKGAKKIHQECTPRPVCNGLEANHSQVLPGTC
jgi:hypothetical protein